MTSRHLASLGCALTALITAVLAALALPTAHAGSPAASSGPGRFRIAGQFAASGKKVRGTVKGRQRQVLGARCKAHGRFTAKRMEQVG